MSNIDKNYEDFLKSLQEDNSGTQESFPFNEDFDIENFIKTTESHSQEPAHTTPVQTVSSPALPTAEQINKFPSSETAITSEESSPITFDGNDDKNYSIKRLEEKLSDLQQRFDEANTSKEEESAFAAELNKTDEEEMQTEPVKSDEEFFSNISSAIQTLKGSLDNIVSTRLRYEENLIRQDQNLITRLKEKTTRLKAINLALNSEVKRSRSEKLEYLRRSAEQTKELLSLRMQLSHAEERTKQGDFKVSGLEQQINLLTQEKNLVDEEISKIRQEKLDYLQNSAEQTRNIMQLRHQLAEKEEALKQEEVKTNFLEQQLKTVEEAHQSLLREKQNSEMQKSETEKTLLLQKDEINSLNNQLAQSRSELAQKSEEATNLRQQLLNLQFAPGNTNNDMAALAVKEAEMLAPLKMSQQEHEQKIALLRAEQNAELQRLRTKAFQEETALRDELQKAENKYSQEGRSVNLLKIQIQNLENNLKSLEQEKSNYKNKSETLTKELDLIRENNQNELANLREKLQKAQSSYDKQQELYNNLETQYENAQREKYYLSEEIKKIMVQKDNALLQNERYLSEIERLKKAQNDLTNELKDEIQGLLANRNQLKQELNRLKQNPSSFGQFQQTKNNLQENTAALSILKDQMATLINSKGNIDRSLLEAREEKLSLLTKLEEQTRKLNAFQKGYQSEIADLTQEKIKIQFEAATKIKELEDKIKIDRETISSLNRQLQEAKFEPSTQDERLAQERLKTQQLTKELEKAEKVFNQDTILLGEIKAQYSRLQSRNEILEQELAKVKAENKQMEQETQNYKLQSEDLRKQLYELKTEISQEREFTKQLSEQINKLKTVNTTLNAALQQMQEQKIEAINTTAKQTQEILELKAQLKNLQTDSKSLNFNQGTVSVNAENQIKIQSLEDELKRISALCMTQTKEINDIKTDNLRLKTAAEEKLLLQNRFNALQRNLNLMTEELKTYKDGSKVSALIKAKAAALTVQLSRVNKEKDNLKNQLEATKVKLQEATEHERRTSRELDTLRQAIKQNENNIAKLKNEIAPLTQTTNPKNVSNTSTDSLVADSKAKVDTTMGNTIKNTFEDTKTKETANVGLNDQQDVATMPKLDVNNLNQTNTSPAKENAESITQRDILAEYDNDEKEISDPEKDSIEFLNNEISVPTVEEIDPNADKMDIADIFKDDDSPKNFQELTQEDKQVIIEEIRPTQVGNINSPVKTAKERIDEDLKISSSENTLTDHSIRRSVISRRPYARNPITTFRKDEEYSDFLKKTKSLFYRIKWSLFKD